MTGAAGIEPQFLYALTIRRGINSFNILLAIVALHGLRNPPTLAKIMNEYYSISQHREFLVHIAWMAFPGRVFLVPCWLNQAQPFIHCQHSDVDDDGCGDGDGGDGGGGGGDGGDGGGDGGDGDGGDGDDGNGGDGDISGDGGNGLTGGGDGDQW